MEDGSFAEFQEIFRIRAANPILTEGEVDYLSPEVPDGVFACTRTLGKQVCVPLVNFNSYEVKGTVRVGEKDVPFDLPPFGYTVLSSTGETPVVPVRSSATGETPVVPVRSLATGELPMGKTLDTGTTGVSPVGVEAPRLYLLDGKPVTAPYQLAAVTNADRSVTWRVASFAGVNPAKTELVFRFAGAEKWFARSAEGAFASPYRVRHPSFDGVTGSIYRHPQGGNCVWDSRLHPLGFSAEHAVVGAVVGDTECVFTCTNDLRRVRRARVLDRIGDDHALHIAFGALDESSRFTLETRPASPTRNDVASPDPAGTGDPRLRVVTGGWMFDNGRIQLFIRRNGALDGYWRKDKDDIWKGVIWSAATYTDIGYGESYTDGKLVSKKFTQAHDVETYMDFRAVRAKAGETTSVLQQGEGVGLEKIVLGFEGALRYKQRFSKMKTPVYFRTVYELTDGDSFKLTQQVKTTSEPKDDRGFLAFMANVNAMEEAEFVDATGFRRQAKANHPNGRILLTRSDEAAAPVRSAKIGLADGGKLHVEFDLDTLDQPANVFCDGNNFFFAWQDCRKNADFRPWSWRGFTATIRSE